MAGVLSLIVYHGLASTFCHSCKETDISKTRNITSSEDDETSLRIEDNEPFCNAHMNGLYTCRAVLLLSVAPPHDWVSLLVHPWHHL